MNRIHIVGRKNSGKTTLMVALVETLTGRGVRVGTIKHTHHHHELDTPGKDSHQHRVAGAAAVGILSPQMNAVFWPPGRMEKNKSESYSQFDALMDLCDVVLVEGDSSTAAPKVEVYRADAGHPCMALSDPSIRAVITDDLLEIETPVWPRSDLDTIVNHLASLQVPATRLFNFK